MLQNAVLTFREVTSAKPWRVDVVLDGVLCGHIDHAGGTYRYFEDFEGAYNDVIWSFADLDLERLEARIRATVV
jgi:hypothetical protein